MTEPGPRLRVAILGAGGIGARHAAAIGDLSDRMELVAVCGRDEDRTAGFAAAWGGRPFTDRDRMLDEARPDLLVVALPPFAHGDEVEAAAARGVHVLAEKPIALSNEAADAMVAAADAAGIVAACGFMYRFGDAVRAVHHLQAAGSAGRPALMTGRFHCNALHAAWWRTRALSGGQVVEQAIHLIDLVRHFLGEPSSVYARSANLFHGAVDGYTGEDVAAMVFGYPDGRVASLTATNAAIPGRWLKDWTVVAERATAHFTGWNDAVVTRTDADPPVDETIAGTTDVFLAQLADVADAIRDRRPPAVPLREGAASLRLALAVRRSADERREILL